MSYIWNVQIYVQIWCRYMCRYGVDTPPQVEAWRSVMPNLRDNAWKWSRPKALVKISSG